MNTPTNHFRGKRTLVVSFDQEKYSSIVGDKKTFRQELDRQISSRPDIFPKEIKEGYTLSEIKISKKLNFYLRRIQIQGTKYTIRPSFVLPFNFGGKS